MTPAISILLATGAATATILRVVKPALIFYGKNYFREKAVTLSRFETIAAIILCPSIAWLLTVPTSDPITLTGWTFILSTLYGVIRCDSAYQIIPDRLHVVGLLGVIMIALANPPASAIPLLWGAGLPLFLFGVSFLYEKLRGQVGLGLGDIKLLLWMGPLLGPQIVWGLMVACLFALFCRGFAILIRGRSIFREPFAFGPYLVIACLGVYAYPLLMQ